MPELLMRVRASRKLRATAACSIGAAALLAIFAAPASSRVGEATPPMVGTPATATLVGTINMADLPPPTTSNLGGLPFLVPDPAAYAAAKAAPSGGAAPEAAIPSVAPTLTPGVALSGAINFTTSMCGCTPPDMAVAVGNGFKMQQVNLAGRIWDANNNPGSVFSLSSFYGTGGDFISDPWLFFDQASQRWFGGLIDISSSSERLAVSTSSSPTTFKLYNVPQGAPGSCGDQGKIGVSDLVVAVSTNIFSNFCNGSFLGVRITVLNKAELVAGLPTIDMAAFGPMTKYFSLVPAQSMSATSTQWYAGVNAGTSTLAHIVKTDGVPPAAVTMAEPFTPTIKRVSDPPNAQQKGTSTLLVTNDSRVNNVVWQSNSLIFTDGTGCVPGGDTTVRSCVRLLAVNTSTGTKTIDKTRSQLGAYLFFPAVQMDPAGTIVLGYGRSSTSLFPELDARPSDPTGVFGAKKVLVTGTAPNTTNRYGDYFAIAIDPSNTAQAWVAGEIGGGTWNTAVRQVTLSP